MPSYTIEWVGSDPHEFNDVNSWAIAGVDAGGNKFKKTKLERPTSAPAPHKGEVVEGTLDAHPRMDYPVRLLVEANGSAPSEAHSGPVSAPNTRSGDDPKQASIEAQSAAKAAGYAATSPEDLHARTLAAYRAIQDCKTGESPNAIEPPLDTAESVQADAETADGDIPF